MSHCEGPSYVDDVALHGAVPRNERTPIMGFDDALNKAKDFANENPDKVEQGLDGASDQIKDRTPDSVDGHVDSGADAARDHFGLGGEDNDGEDNQGN